MVAIKELVERYFQVRERGSSLRTELRAGVTSFLTMSYIMLVNPQVLCALTAGNTPPVGAFGQAVVATALSSAIGCVLVGVGSNAPFVVAPGVGLSAYLAYGLVGNGKLSWDVAMSCCFVSGMVVCALALCGGTRLLSRAMPKSIKLGIVAGMGLLIALIGMHSVGLVQADPVTIVRLGPMDARAVVSLGGLLLLAVLQHFNVTGSILLAIVVIALVEWARTDTWPTQVLEVPKLRYGATHNLNFDVSSTWHARAQAMTTGVLSFLFVAVFDVSGVMYGMARLAGLATDSNPTLPGKHAASLVFVSTGVTSMVAAAMGCTPCIIGVESSAGILDGGRTGLVALVAAGLFLLSLFFAPLFAAFPSAATSPVLIFIGSQMLSEATHIDWLRIEQAVPSFLTIAMMPCTFSIGNGILFGVAASAALWISTGEAYAVWRRRQQAARGITGDAELSDLSAPGSDAAGAKPFTPWWARGTAATEDKVGE